MDKELKAKWVAALRSGEYQQGYATLYDSGIDRYCCLGVLISVADVFDGPAAHGGRYEWLDNQLGQDRATKCAELNDSTEASFSQIADWIEANIPEDE
jgi:DNA-directed RNA polymerase subunit N (RpoN/RPB10)